MKLGRVERASRCRFAEREKCRPYFSKASMTRRTLKLSSLLKLAKTRKMHFYGVRWDERETFEIECF